MIKTFTPTVQIINEQGVKTPCIARTYKDGQWRQCRIQYYTLHPLYDINNNPIIAAPLIGEPVNEIIHIAQKVVSATNNTYVTSLDGYVLTDKDGTILVYGG